MAWKNHAEAGPLGYPGRGRDGSTTIWSKDEESGTR